MGKVARMNQAKKLVDDGTEIEFDFSAPVVVTQKAKDATHVCTRCGTEHGALKDQAIWEAVGVVMVNAVAAAYPQGVDREESKIWGPWQEVLSEPHAGVVKVPKKIVRWLYSTLNKTDLKMHPGLSQQRWGVLDYLEELLTASEETKPSDG